MKRTLPIVLTSFLVALPVAAQEGAGAAEAEGPADKPADAAAPTPPAGPVEAEASTDASASAKAAEVTPDVARTAAVTSDAATPAVETQTSSSPSQRGSDAAASDNSWKFEFHGYLRAPMRLGIGSRDNPGPGQSSTTLHYPVIPDDQYLSWQSTSHNKKDWSEMFFSIGNGLAKGTLAVTGYNFSEASWTDADAQGGISQGWLELTPDLGYENVRLSVKAGSFWARYGMAGKWDAGEYDTYLFGRLHQMGELIRVEYDIDDANTIWVEHGIGTRRPDPSQFNNARFTMLHHGHVAYKMGATAEIAAHYIHSWTQEEDRIIPPRNSFDQGPMRLNDPYNPPNYPSTLMGLPDGKLWVAGIDAKLELGAFGYFYAGYSHIGAENAVSVGPAVEVLHAFGGGHYQNGVTDNYFGPSCMGFSEGDITGVTPQSPVNAPPGGRPNCSLGTGKVDTILAQWDFSLTNFLQQSSGGQKFWGDGPDFRFLLYGMLNKVSSDVALYDGITKLKYGVDLQWAALPWLTVATRYDRLQPHSEIPEQSFSILSPRLVFRSQFVTREQISLQYSRYLYNTRECAGGLTPAFNTAVNPANPAGPVPNRVGHPFEPGQLNCVQPPAAPGSSESFGSTYLTQDAGNRGAPTTRPDVNVIKIEASMWW